MNTSAVYLDPISMTFGVLGGTPHRLQYGTLEPYQSKVWALAMVIATTLLTLVRRKFAKLTLTLYQRNLDMVAGA